MVVALILCLAFLLFFGRIFWLLEASSVVVVVVVVVVVAAAEAAAARFLTLSFAGSEVARIKVIPF